MTIRFVVKKPAGRKKPIVADSRRSTVYVRLKDGTAVDQMCRTSVLVNPAWWDSKRELVNEFSACPDLERNAVNGQLAFVRQQLASRYVVDRMQGTVGREWLRNVVDGIQNASAGSRPLLLDTFNDFVSGHPMSDGRRMQYLSLGRMLVRYEKYRSCLYGNRTTRRLAVVDITADVLADLYDYLMNEDQRYREHPEYFDAGPSGQNTPKPRSRNTMSDIFKKLRTYFKWCVSSGIISKSPFAGYHVDSELYGTPVYLTHAEMNLLLNHNFYHQPHLARQRDVFLFQCNVGCRVGDLVRLKKSDVTDGQITYIPHKTSRERPVTVSVPLNQTARLIVGRYADDGREQLLPFLSTQKYNAAIKQVLEKAGITRTVTILDPLTRTEKKVRICDIASSHMARRTFAGNIYKKVKDPALVSSLTGHKEGSKAFARYRDIDAEMKRELVELLE